MNMLWDIEGVQIPSVSMNRWEGQQMWTSGIGWYTQKSGQRHFQWEATAISTGWYIVITSSTGKVGEVAGSTFNLPLEIAAAARRLL
jgi:hypothetical protein